MYPAFANLEESTKVKVLTVELIAPFNVVDNSKSVIPYPPTGSLTALNLTYVVPSLI